MYSRYRWSHTRPFLFLSSAQLYSQLRWPGLEHREPWDLMQSRKCGSHMGFQGFQELGGILGGRGCCQFGLRLLWVYLVWHSGIMVGKQQKRKPCLTSAGKEFTGRIWTALIIDGTYAEPGLNTLGTRTQMFRCAALPVQVQFRPPQRSKYRHKVRYETFGFPVHVKFMFVLYSAKCEVASCLKKPKLNVHTLM